MIEEDSLETHNLSFLLTGWHDERKALGARKLTALLNGLQK